MLAGVVGQETFSRALDARARGVRVPGPTRMTTRGPVSDALPFSPLRLSQQRNSMTLFLELHRDSCMSHNSPRR